MTNLTNEEIWKIVLNEIKAIAKRLSCTPSMNELRHLGKYDLLNALFHNLLLVFCIFTSGGTTFVKTIT